MAHNGLTAGAQTPTAEQDRRPVTTGLLAVATVSSRLGASAARSMRSALLAVGEGVARTRGPFGRSISREDADTLELLAEVLDVDGPDPHLLFAAARSSATPPDDREDGST